MKKTIICIAVLLSFISCSAFAQDVRVKRLFNDNWYFHKGEVENGEKTDLDHKDWRNIDLPHDWSVEGPFSEKLASGTGYLPAGIAWYRKTFDISPELQSKKLALYFDGVYKNSEVWINGHYLGKRPNGHIPFQYEITKYLNKEGKNTVAVKVDHTQFADSRWYNGSGIYRNVYLIATEPIHISQWGIAFTTPEVSKEKASAKVAVSMENNTASVAKVRVRSRLLDQKGNLVKEVQEQVALDAGEKGEKDLSFQVDKPKLWSTETPNLYQLQVALFVDDQKID